MRPNLERLMSGVTTACALALTLGFFMRQFGSAPAASAQATLDATRRVENWPEVWHAGNVMGRDGARVEILEFGDFECPACRVLFANLQQLDHLFPGSIALSFRHYPLPYHRFAMPSARAAECAGAERRFKEMYEVLYERQDSLGLLSWTEMGKRAGVTDSGSFATCLAQSAIPVRVGADLEVGRMIGVAATPTVAINGWILSRPPTLDELVATTRELLRGSTTRQALRTQ
jgi:protein-disulfide isomerase